MERRDFLAVSATAGVALAAGAPTVARAESSGERQVLELRAYHFDTEEQARAFQQFMATVAVPALNRAAIAPVGIFVSVKEFSPVYVLLPHDSLESTMTLTQRLLADDAFTSAGADYLNVPYTEPTYARVETALLHAFAGMPRLETPTDSPDRVFQLRIYESPTTVAAQTKIEMFNSGEIDIFRKTGLGPVFFGERIAGSLMPNLTYMVGFADKAAQKAAWRAFSAHPDWKALQSKPEYAKKNMVSHITNIVLKPGEGSQI